MADRGDLAVTVAMGGPPVPVADFGAARVVPLPQVFAADAGFKTLVDGDGRPIDDAWRARRARALMDLYETVDPQVLLFEMFPFGRRQFRFELLPLLAAARRRSRPTKVVSSVRDVLVTKKKPGRDAEMVDLARTWFDRVLVHGDPRLIPFEATFPPGAAIADLVRYTGYVVDRRPRGAPSDAGRGEVVVSIGGGAVGGELLRTALAARPLTRAADRTWRLLAGPNTDPELVRELRARAPDGVVVEPARPDFQIILENCLLSVSMAGYNTVMDMMTARPRAVVVPFAEGGETEQAFRARLLAARGVFTMLEPADLTTESLAAAVDAELGSELSAVPEIDLSGAETSAALIAEMAGAAATTN
ncbi:MAG: glycosyl transferase [Hyphomicrobiales bacterium]|nr:glycosyl transferase [Hyphomicrobiales bacterium]MCP5373268.1 glycosyl transferase [Hyphomicrobiales bacterium]